MDVKSIIRHPTCVATEVAIVNLLSRVFLVLKIFLIRFNSQNKDIMRLNEALCLGRVMQASPYDVQNSVYVVTQNRYHHNAKCIVAD